MRKVRKIVDNYQIINIIMSKYIDANSFPRALRWFQGNEWLTWLSSLIILTLSTILNFLCNIVRDTGPEYYFSCSTECTLRSNMSCVKLVQYICPHCGWDDNLVAFEDYTIFCADLVSKLKVWECIFFALLSIFRPSSFS